LQALIPLELETRRLRLRRFVLDDWQPLHRHYSDPECTRFTFGRALTDGESWRAMAGMEGHWSLRGYGPYALVEKAANALVGAAGLWYPGDFPETEVKWLLLREFWGRGYATEAVREVQSIAATHLAMRPVSLIRRENDGSRRVAVAVGAVHERDLAFREADWMVYRHPRRVAAE
jgi:RimJ/RimL family protein N-acetyltransferase